jgi:steroid delta-isomerase-like uncharacterized protein
MTPEEVKSFLAKRQRAFSTLDVAALSDLYAENAVYDSPAAGGTVTGRQAIEKIHRSWFDAFPDFKLEDERFVVEGTSVAHIARAVGTNVGGFMGLPATGKQFHFNAAFVFTIEDGRIARERRIYDFTGMLVEIGVLKAKPL